MKLLTLILALACCLTGWAADVAPSITGQPVALTVRAGCPVTFAVTATGTAPLAYQWHLAGDLMAGATTSRYTWTTEYQTAEPAEYWVVITNAAGAVTSAVTTLYVTEPGDCPAAALPKVRMGNGVAVSMMTKAEEFLPLALSSSMARLITGVTNAELAGSARAMMHPLTRGLSLSVSSNVVYSNSWFLKNVKGITAGSLGEWGSAIAAASNCAWNTVYCCGDTNGWGIYQVPCVLVNRRFTVSPGHTGRWNGTNCYQKWVGTNGQAYFVSSLQTVDFMPPFCQNGSLPEHLVQLALDLGYPTNFDGKVTILGTAMPDDVLSAVLWPTNLADYVATDTMQWQWAMAQTGQFAQWGLTYTPLTVGWLQSSAIEIEWDDQLALANVPTGLGGSSGSPGYSVLGDQAILYYGYANTRYQELFEAAMLYLWTNNGMSAETCPGFEFADLSGFRKLR